MVGGVPASDHWGVRGPTAPLERFGSVPGGNGVRMAGYTKTNLRRDVEDQAPKFGMPEGLESRFARSQLGGETLGVTLFTLAPGFRMPFGHKHEQQEEAYVVVRG